MTLFRFPLARITVFFIVGIVVQHQLTFSTSMILGALAVAGVPTVVLWKTGKIYFTIACFASSVLVGMFCWQAHVAVFHETHFYHHIPANGQNCVLALTVNEKLKTTDFYERYICEVVRIDSTEVSGKILLNVNRKTPKKHIPIGSDLIVYSNIREHQKPLNPNQFDYASYLRNKNIFAQVRADSFIIVGQQKGIFYYSDKLRQRILAHLRNGGIREKELQVFAALFLGQQQEIDSEILRDYQFAGAVHILSVSGLHVGFVLIMLNFLLDYLPKTGRWRLIKLIVVIFGLWGFAILAGLSPSVVRSVVMFSFVAIGMHLRRSTNVFHTLLISMLLILTFRPGFLFDVGFQLSYLALFFILWLQPMLNGMLSVENRVLRYFWNILTVSFAAQIGTLPLSLYYFHQFPGLFFITNIIVIPMLSLIMVLGLTVALWAVIAPVQQFPVYLLQQSIWILDEIIATIARLEAFVFRNIPFTFGMLILSYALIGSLGIWLKKPSFRKLATVLSIGLLLQLSVISERIYAKNKREWIVFNSRKSTLIVNRSGKHFDIKTRDSIPEKALEFMLQPYVTANFIRSTEQHNLTNLDYFANRTILILDSSNVFLRDISPDVILLTQSPKINLERALTDLKPQLVIADASNFRTNIDRWKRTCQKQKIPFHATAEKGCYRLQENP